MYLKVQSCLKKLHHVTEREGLKGGRRDETRDPRSRECALLEEEEGGA